MTNAVLFDGMRAPKRKLRTSKATRPADPDVSRLQTAAMMHYAERYQARFDEPPNIDKKDWALMKRLIEKYGAEKVRARIEAFLRLDDEFLAQRTGYTIPAFYSQWDRLCSLIAATTKKAQGDTPPDCAHRPPCGNAVEHGRRLLKELGQTKTARG